MPNIRSAKKRMRQNAKRRLRNQQVKSSLRTQLKKQHKAISEQNIELAEGLMNATKKKIDKSCAKGVLHKNTASRMKSRLAKSINRAKAEKHAS